MAEYLSREAVNDLIEDVRNNHFILMCDRVTLALLKSKVAEIPAADVQPVKRGEWIPQGDDMWLCSNCKENIIFSMHESDRTEKQRYCSRCGARMGGSIDG